MEKTKTEEIIDQLLSKEKDASRPVMDKYALMGVLALNEIGNELKNIRRLMAMNSQFVPPDLIES